MVEDRRRSRFGRLRRSRRAWIGGATGLLGVASVLMLLAPQAGAFSFISFTAPYSSFTSNPSSGTSSSGSCASIAQSASPAFSLSSGVFQERTKAVVTSCPTTYEFASASFYDSLQSPSFAGPNFGTNYVYVSWSTGYTVHVALTIASGNSSGNSSGNVSYAFAYASAFLEVFAYIVNASTGALVPGSSSAATTLASYSFSSTGSATVATTTVSMVSIISGFLHKNRSYEVVVGVEGSVFVESYFASATAVASINLAGTNGITLGSVGVY